MAQRKNAGTTLTGVIADNISKSIESSQAAALQATAEDSRVDGIVAAKQGGGVAPRNAEPNANTTAQQGGGEPPKKQSRAKTIKERRPAQVSTHYTIAEKFAIDKAVAMMKIRGVKDASAEELVHTAVLEFLNNKELSENPEVSTWWCKEMEE